MWARRFHFEHWLAGWTWPHNFALHTFAVFQNLGHLLFSDLGVCRAVSSVFSHASLSAAFTFLNVLSQRHHQHCWALGSAGSILELSGVDIGAASGVFSQEPLLQSPATKTLWHKCSTTHEREMFRDHQKRDGDNRWIAMKHQGLSLQNSSLAGNDRQVEERQYQTFQTVLYQREQTGCCLGI